ncbi:MAG TPA: hypothetical protein VL326_08275 [Kofleriaceae bacterium]|jgi:hypothetical protein|nr:hypothetical protein [Kofleriaceae bacterium]
MKRGFILALILATALPPARSWAAPKDEDEEEEEDSDEKADKKSDKKAEKKDSSEEEESSDEDSSDEDSGDEDSGEAPTEKAKAATTSEEEAEVDSDAGLRPKQNLTGHDLGTNKKANEFERDRFFVDKVDSEKTENGTLIQGSIASSTFFYKESGGAYPNLMAGENAGPSRLFTELRLQTDFRHIKASRWEARIDTRGRFVGGGGTNIVQTPENHIQSGLFGQNELELRELWLTRVGKRTDLFFGRQFIPDLGGVKIDGIRFDYAKSAKLTLIGFAGLFPLRGSRSVTTDYAAPPTNPPSTAVLVGTGGFGAAYRTINSYGAIGGVAQVPFQQEQPRFYVTSSGYLRSGSKLDFYHFALLDVLGAMAQESTAHVSVTNLSAGVNIKPDPRLRLTASVNRVDTETLNVQANEVLGAIDQKDPATDPNYGGNKVVQNEAVLQRLATNQARAGVSAGLGKQQRFELSTAVTYRERQAFTLQPPVPTMTNPAVSIPAAKSIEVWGSFVDRRSFKDARIGLDLARSFGIGGTSYQRSNTQTVRLFVLKDVRDGRGEIETEVSYAKVLNDAAAAMTACTSGGGVESLLNNCYGHSTNTLISAGAQLVYRLKADWLAIANLYILRTSNQSPNPAGMGAPVEDPAILGFTGFLRIAKRF